MENRPPTELTGPFTNDERSYAIDVLKTTQADLHQSLEGLSDYQLSYKPSAERWSVAACVEHIALVEGRIFKGVQFGMETPVNRERRAEISVSDVDVIKAMRSRKNARLAPAGTEPTGRFGDAAGALQAFDRVRNAVIDFGQNTQEDLRSHYFDNKIFGTIDIFQALLMMANHSERHRKQIEEIKADTEFPR
ncbi:DinB family protein [Spirosoma luteum]|uniref:DinB family protein n=1 Tax=Spirosoma luteum TaxID=431553 RepID=UPI00036A31F4|nr:DinB family protein [Spirosoma luteum]